MTKLSALRDLPRRLHGNKEGLDALKHLITNDDRVWLSRAVVLVLSVQYHIIGFLQMVIYAAVSAIAIFTNPALRDEIINFLIEQLKKENEVRENNNTSCQLTC
jgi:hypothetical protein